MDIEEKLSALITLAESSGIFVRRVASAGGEGPRRGGDLVRLKGKEILFLDESASLADQADAVASALAGRGQQLESRYLPPEIRQAIDDAAGT
jgi:hypothetical protein